MSDQLPLDPDLGADAPRGSRPLHLRATALLVVATGGVVGTAAREGLALALPTRGLPLTILLINAVGAFLLGLLLESLARRGPDEGVRRTLRLLLGTGVMGGFTTYSAFASDTAVLLTTGHAPTALLYVVLTLVGGALATASGIAVAAATHRVRSGSRG